MGPEGAGDLTTVEPRLLVPTSSLQEYIALGGGQGLERADSLGPEGVVDLVTRSGLRGRGGAGFPTGTKWRSLLSAAGERFVVCNAAEGEPATFKDRLLLRRNPYPVLEGIVIAARTVGAQLAFIGLKDQFTLETETVSRAIHEMGEAGMLGSLELRIVSGPDRYLFGEETGLIGVIDGRGPYPREVRPFMQGPFANSSTPNPTLVNNVETLANVPSILTKGAEWFRSVGTDGSPGTMLFTVAGDVACEGVFELPLGTSLRKLIEGPARGVRDHGNVKAVLPGASSAVVTADMLDLPLDFDAFRRAGTGLGAGGFAVYDETACMAEVARQFSRFLYVESCAQCPACKMHSEAINDFFTSLHDGSGTLGDIEEIVARADRVTDGQKCALPTGTKLVVLSLVQAFAEEFAAHVGAECPRPRTLGFPKLVDYDEEAGKFLYDRHYGSTRPDWMPVSVGSTNAEA
ncbi:MAG: NADH-ubiquinone oxidoreductase-F iron-sulfur binding region domain-containing protein [Actinomycetota bacterium]